MLIFVIFIICEKLNLDYCILNTSFEIENCRYASVWGVKGINEIYWGLMDSVFGNGG